METDHAAAYFIHFIMGWFAVTLEVFLRRDFGERYFNRVNFFAGLIVLLGFNVGQNTIGGVWQQGEEPTWKESMMWIFLLAYVGFSIIHLLRFGGASGQDDPCTRWILVSRG